jgi:hypothetical protein
VTSGFLREHPGVLLELSNLLRLLPAASPATSTKRGSSQSHRTDQGISDSEGIHATWSTDARGHFQADFGR